MTHITYQKVFIIQKFEVEYNIVEKKEKKRRKKKIPSPGVGNHEPINKGYQWENPD
jgi:hypothetical protein